MKTVNSKNWTAEDVEEVLNIIKIMNTISLNKPVITDSDVINETELGDFIIDISPGPQEIVENKDVVNRLMKYIDKLPARQSRIIKMRYGFETGSAMTLEEIAKHYKVTRERIRQVELKALSKLKWLIMVKGKCHSINDF